MADLKNLYQDLVLDHNRHPRNFGELPTANRRAEGHNHLCGDKVTVELLLRDDIIEDIHFTGEGCAISIASASAMTVAVKGIDQREARESVACFLQMIEGRADQTSLHRLGELDVFLGVRAFPMRLKCATLPWHTLRAALDDSDNPQR